MHNLIRNQIIMTFDSLLSFLNLIWLSYTEIDHKISPFAGLNALIDWCLISNGPLHTFLVGLAPLEELITALDTSLDSFVLDLNGLFLELLTSSNRDEGLSVQSLQSLDGISNVSYYLSFLF